MSVEILEIDERASKRALFTMLNRFLGSTQNPSSDQGKPWRQTCASIN